MRRRCAGSRSPSIRAVTASGRCPAAKIVRHVPEEVIPAHVEAGAAVSINALAKKYAGSEVGVRLAEAMQRDSLGHKLVVKARKTEPKPVQAANVTPLFERTVL